LGRGSYKDFVLLVLSNDTNTGYVVQPIMVEGLESDREAPSFVRRVLDSFELVTAPTTPVTTVSPTTSSLPQGQPQQQLEQSVGGLTARLNADSFTTGDTITVNGTVRERGPYTAATIDVIDPQGKTVEFAQVRVTADNIFTYSFLAGQNEGFLGQRMVESGNYLMGVQFGTDRVEFTFNYNASIAAPEATASTTPPQQQEQQPFSPSPFSQQIQSQREQQLPPSPPQNHVVLIRQGSSSLTDTAFKPNPVEVKIGDSVTWINDDSQPHTVTSGQNGQPDGKFDSSPNFNPLIPPGQTFKHKFTEGAGQYPYYCALHPNMVGTVSVVS
jgi:plastocyanin